MKTKFIFFIFLFIVSSVLGQVKLPKLISDGMVLQRNTKVNIWGWASADEKVEVEFLGSTYTTSADDNGEWSIVLDSLESGGPYSMHIDASNSITINDILVGDVWICSGQSNMELTMERASPIYEEEIASSENPFIRQFEVPDRYNFNEPQKDLESGEWKEANPENIMTFSAVAYFFAKEIYDYYKIPVGLINASLGGSPAEAWISEDALKQFPKYYEEAQKFKDSSLIIQIENEDQVRINNWYSSLNQKDEGLNDKKGNWYSSTIDASGWALVKVPGFWSNSQIGRINGSVWFRKKFNVPTSSAGKPALLILGRIKDADSVFINNEFVGNTSYEWPPRRYKFPEDVLHEGENTIAVRVICSSGRGGFIPDKEYKIVFDQNSIDLAGEWRYHVGAEMDSLAQQTFIRWQPLGLFNGMIAPLSNYSINGVIWYQGESNAKNPGDYAELFSTLIKDWRNHWQEGDFPFIYVQLANFMDPKDEPSESDWALIREAQLKTLSIPNTRMAVIIDIGDWNDIHPLNKKDVGKRLFLNAQHLVYGDTSVVYSGPIYKSMQIDSNKIILSFTNIVGGLVSKGDSLKYFSICGSDGKFVWANAKIKNNKVVVWSNEIPNPVAVRYAWADDPEGANLYNVEGLPASPFRTDDFQQVILK